MFEPTSKVIRLNKSYANHDGSPHHGLMVFFLCGCICIFIYMMKLAFKHKMGWERASMPTRQERYDRTVWAGGVSNYELLETVNASKPHRGPHSRHQTELNRLEFGGSRPAAEEGAEGKK
jgi:hypothetical protein